jgi:hypothetical protein
MAQFKSDFVAKFRTTLDEDVEETAFVIGDEVRLMAKWQRHYLVKDDEGHFYNIPREFIEE